MIEEFFKTTPNGVFTIIGALTAFLAALIVYRKKGFRDAADSFRKNVLTQVNGVIPNNGVWLKPEIEQLKISIPAIKQHALELRPHIPFYRQKKFDETVMEYCRLLTNLEYNDYVADTLYSSRENKEVPLKEVVSGLFYKILSYTN